MEYPIIMKAVWDGLNHAGKNYRQILKVRGRGAGVSPHCPGHPAKHICLGRALYPP